MALLRKTIKNKLTIDNSREIDCTHKFRRLYGQIRGIVFILIAILIYIHDFENFIYYIISTNSHNFKCNVAISKTYI